MMNKIYDLMETRKLIALMVISTICYLAVIGDVSVNEFLPLSMLIASFYFSFKNNKEKIDKGDPDVIESINKV